VRDCKKRDIGINKSAIITKKGRYQLQAKSQGAWEISRYRRDSRLKNVITKVQKCSDGNTVLTTDTCVTERASECLSAWVTAGRNEWVSEWVSVLLRDCLQGGLSEWMFLTLSECRKKGVSEGMSEWVSECLQGGLSEWML